MSNWWHFRLYFSPRPALDAPTLETLVGKYSYSLVSPDSHQIHVNQFNDQTYDIVVVQVDTLEAATKALSHDSATVTLWKGDQDVDLGAQVTGVAEQRWLQANGNVGVPTRGTLSLSVLASSFTRLEERHYRRELSIDLQNMFAHLVHWLNADYGYAAEEDAIELYGLRQIPPVDLAAHRPPPALYWLNYFSTDYLNTVGRAKLAAFGFDCLDLPNGCLAQLGEHPWQLDWNKLAAINRAWSKSLSP